MKFQFPVWLEGTEEQKKAEAERQSLALASHSRAKLTEAERLIGRGKLLEETARINLDAARRKDKTARILAQNQLADALAMQGRYAEAADLHTEKSKRKYFREMVRAIEKPDDEKCKCSDRKFGVDNKELTLTPRFEREKIFSPVHGEIVSLVQCSKCGHKNARKLRSRLLPQQAAITRNEMIARGNDLRGIQSDLQLLNAAT